MSIVKQLDNAKNGILNADKTNEIISDVKLLLDGDSSEDLRIANALGKYHSLAVAQEKIGNAIELKELDKKYAGNVYNIADIKQLCIKYRMRFLQSKHFAGHLDVSALHKIKEFAKETNTEITDGNLQSNFFILAPDESFKLNTERFPKKSDDPAIFYRIDESHYRLIHKWGADFTVGRLLTSLMFRSFKERIFYKGLIWMAIAVSIVFGLSSFAGWSKWWFLATLPAFLLAFIDSYTHDLDDTQYPKKFSPHTWDKPTRGY